MRLSALVLALLLGGFSCTAEDDKDPTESDTDTDADSDADTDTDTDTDTDSDVDLCEVPDKLADVAPNVVSSISDTAAEIEVEIRVAGCHDPAGTTDGMLRFLVHSPSNNEVYCAVAWDFTGAASTPCPNCDYAFEFEPSYPGVQAGSNLCNAFQAPNPADTGAISGVDAFGFNDTTFYYEYGVWYAMDDSDFDASVTTEVFDDRVYFDFRYALSY